ncbi:MAG: alcohol dehydrogenase [Leptospiraceae bacterium]|nr:MAG: alcohol dehydrogenase [Leptospiraceae bacterium]
MKAALYYKNNKKLIIKDISIEDPKDNEVQVKVMACGICGSDLHLIHGILKPIKDPIIPGHEASGVIEKVGKNVKQFKIGDRVVISAGTSCGKCDFCKNHQENLCEEVGVLGFNRDGAFAQYINIPETNIALLPENIPFEEGAILADAVSTPYHAIKYAGNFQKGQNILIIGCGGLGIHAIKIAKALEANQIYAFDIDEFALENAKKAGANHVYNSKHIKDTIKKIQKEIKFSLILDFTGNYEFIEPLLRLLYSGGKYILVGLSKKELQIKIPALIVFRSLSICGSYGSDSRALPELIQLYQENKLNLKDSISGIYPLEEINECFEKLEKRINNPIRLVIAPNL